MDNDREPRRRAVTPEWAAEVSDDLRDLRTMVARLLAHHGLGEGQTPNTVTKDDRGMFSPGSGWIPTGDYQYDDTRPAFGAWRPDSRTQVRASEGTAYEAIAAAREAIKNARKTDT